MKGRFITLEGVDGCGKTTQLQRLEQWLTVRALPFIVTAEPGGTAIGRSIRRVLLDSRNSAMVPLAELLLYAADRAQHVGEVIRPALAAGTSVISDRFTDATVAFQGHGRGFDLRLCDQLNQLATGELKPDLTLLFDLPVELALQRIRDRKRLTASADEARGYDESRLDNEQAEFHRRVRAGYLAAAAAAPDRIRIINAAGSVEAVWQETEKVIAPLFQPADR